MFYYADWNYANEKKLKLHNWESICIPVIYFHFLAAKLIVTKIYLETRPDYYIFPFPDYAN